MLGPISSERHPVAAISDLDGDRVADDEDNCVSVPNRNQRDSNSDGYGNACDPDLNNDYIVDHLDFQLFKKSLRRRARFNRDADFDGDGRVNIRDYFSISMWAGLEPGPAALPNRDSDGFVDFFDNCPDLSNPDQSDSDEDQVGDRCEKVAAPELKRPGQQCILRLREMARPRCEREVL